MLLLLGIIYGCNLQKKIANGKEAFELKQYATAIDMLNDEYSKANNQESKAYLSFLIGESKLALRQIPEASEWYAKSYKHSSKEVTLKRLAESLKRQGAYAQSLAAYKELQQKYSSNTYASEQKFIQAILDSKRNIPDESYNVESVSFNTEFNEYSPFVFQDKIIIFASDRPTKEGADVYKWNGLHYSDLYEAKLENFEVQSFDPFLNTDQNEGSGCMNADGSEFYFTRCEELQLRNKHCRIYKSQKVRGQWTDPVAISFFNEDVNVGHPALMAQDSLMIFSVGPHGNYDSYDLYYSRLLPTGWTKAAYLEGAINTEGDEKFPTSRKDTLYFSSDKLSGLGGLDIYQSYLDEVGKFTRPEALVSPINSEGDDFGISFIEDMKKGLRSTGYFCSSRQNSEGDDIYFFEERILTIDKDTSPNEDKPIVPTIYIAGKIVDKETGNSLPFVDVVVNQTTSLKTDKNGALIFDGEVDKNYLINATVEGYFTNSTNLTSDLSSLPANKTSHTINFKIELEPIKLNEEIVLENIFYDFDKWNIRSDAEPTLDSLAGLLKLNPGLKIELASHTDCRGEVEYNLDLSTKRAKSAVEFLQTKGIAGERLTYKGFGEGNPTVNCICESCLEEQHQQNRRTTFKILEY